MLASGFNFSVEESAPNPTVSSSPANLFNKFESTKSVTSTPIPLALLGRPASIVLKIFFNSDIKSFLCNNFFYLH